MSYAWSDNIELAKELASQATASANPEARRRAAIFLAYNAVFILARNHLRDKEGHSIPRTSDVHRYVADQFDLNPNPTYQSVASNLKMLRQYRNKATYDDKFDMLVQVTRISLRRAEEVIADLSSL